VLETGVHAGDLFDVVLGQLVTLVAETLLHLLKVTRGIDELHLAAPFRQLAVRHKPDIGVDSGIVEQLIRKRDDGI
jgi:hypothetical protein